MLVALLASCGGATTRHTPATGDPGDDTGGDGGSGGDDTTGGGTGGQAGAGATGGRAGSGGTAGTGGGSAGTGGEAHDAAPSVEPDAGSEPDAADVSLDAAPADAARAGDVGPHGDGPAAPPTDDPFPAGPAPIGTGWTEIFPKHDVDFPPGQVRYTEDNGKFHMWLFNDDASKFPGRDAGPRSEIHFYNDYSTGQAQYQGDYFIAKGCAHASVMQIFGAVGRATAAMFWAMPDSFNYYNMQSIYAPAWDHFFRLNVTHDTATGEIDVYINGQMKAKLMDHGATTHYFKSGIYHQPNMSPRCDVFIQNIHIYTK